MLGGTVSFEGRLHCDLGPQLTERHLEQRFHILKKKHSSLEQYLPCMHSPLLPDHLSSNWVGVLSRIL